MGELEWRAGQWLDEMRSHGHVVVAVAAVGVPVETWRAAMRMAAKQAGLRIRTGLSNDETAVWAYHVDHESTEAEKAAAWRTMGTLFDENSPTYSEYLAEERRKRIRPVKDPPP